MKESTRNKLDQMFLTKSLSIKKFNHNKVDKKVNFDDIETSSEISVDENVNLA